LQACRGGASSQQLLEQLQVRALSRSPPTSPYRLPSPAKVHPSKTKKKPRKRAVHIKPPTPTPSSQRQLLSSTRSSTSAKGSQRRVFNFSQLDLVEKDQLSPRISSSKRTNNIKNPFMLKPSRLSQMYNLNSPNLLHLAKLVQQNQQNQPNQHNRNNSYDYAQHLSLRSPGTMSARLQMPARASPSMADMLHSRQPNLPNDLLEDSDTVGQFLKSDLSPRVDIGRGLRLLSGTASRDSPVHHQRNNSSSSTRHRRSDSGLFSFSHRRNDSGPFERAFTHRRQQSNSSINLHRRLTSISSLSRQALASNERKDNDVSEGRDDACPMFDGFLESLDVIDL
jgi:hypothetical protein